MQSANLVEFFRQSPLFASLDEDELKKIAGLATPRRFRKGEFVFLEGDTVSSFHIVQEGRVKVFKQSPSGKEFTVGVFRCGEAFGECAVFCEGPCPASAQALDEAIVLAIRREDFLPFVARNLIIAMRVIGMMAERTKRAHDTLMNMAAERVEQRLARVLLTLSSEYGSALPFTKHEIAGMAGTTTETAIRLMSRFQDSGIIRSARGKITILDETKLRLLSSGPPLV